MQRALRQKASQSTSHHGASWRDLNGGDSASVQHYESTAMLAAKGSAVGGKGADNMVNRPCFADGFFVFERDVNVGAADEAYPQHDGCHGDQRIPGSGALALAVRDGFVRPRLLRRCMWLARTDTAFPLAALASSGRFEPSARPVGYERWGGGEPP
jgi:hypothetical protein